MMGRDELLRRSLVALAAAVVVTGVATASVRKAVATYVFGILAIAGVLLPDWEFFDRDFSQWLTPMPASRRTAAAAAAEREHDIWRIIGLLVGGPAALLLSKAKALWLMTLFCAAAGGWFSCVFACSIGPDLSYGPRKYAMVLATLVLSTPVGVVDVSSTGFKPYPLRMAVLTTIYGFGLYKWWMYVSH